MNGFLLASRRANGAPAGSPATIAASPKAHFIFSAATSNAADLLGHSDIVGSIKPEKFADVIAVTGDPLKDISVLEHVEFVMKDGKVYKQ